MTSAVTKIASSSALLILLIFSMKPPEYVCIWKQHHTKLSKFQNLQKKRFLITLSVVFITFSVFDKNVTKVRR